jgi:hypothetical protein
MLDSLIEIFGSDGVKKISQFGDQLGFTLNVLFIVLDTVVVILIVNSQDLALALHQIVVHQNWRADP